MALNNRKPDIYANAELLAINDRETYLTPGRVVWAQICGGRGQTSAPVLRLAVVVGPSPVIRDFLRCWVMDYTRAPVDVSPFELRKVKDVILLRPSQIRWATAIKLNGKPPPNP